MQFLPWKVAGRVTERQLSGDDVVRITGWVFNNETGPSLTIAEFVRTGDEEVGSYLDLFRFAPDVPGTGTLVEIGCGIGRMTCAFTRQFRTVIAGDLDVGFLERCRGAVSEFGRSDHLRTLEVGDGRTLALASDIADCAFSYITLQHCDRDDALALTSEAVRVVKPGGRIVLNYRSHAPIDVVLLPLAAMTRGAFRVPGIGSWLSRHRTLTRLAWQANRFAPHEIIGTIRDSITDVEIWHNPRRTIHTDGATDQTFEGINPHHWWLVAKVA